MQVNFAFDFCAVSILLLCCNYKTFYYYEDYTHLPNRLLYFYNISVCISCAYVFILSSPPTLPLVDNCNRNESMISYVQATVLQC